jgi:plasmid replication initiation protein
MMIVVNALESALYTLTDMSGERQSAGAAAFAKEIRAALPLARLQEQAVELWQEMIKAGEGCDLGSTMDMKVVGKKATALLTQIEELQNG